MNKVLTQYADLSTPAVTIKQKEVKNYSDGKYVVTLEVAYNYSIPYYHFYYLRSS